MTLSKASTILFVDDDHDFLKMIKLQFKLSKLNTICVTSVDKAISRISGEISLIITDFNMPHKTGLDLLEWVKINNVQIPTILQTANTDPFMIKRAYSLGLKDHIYKPYDFKDLLVLCTKYLS